MHTQCRKLFFFQMAAISSYIKQGKWSLYNYKNEKCTTEASIQGTGSSNKVVHQIGVGIHYVN